MKERNYFGGVSVCGESDIALKNTDMDVVVQERAIPPSRA